MPTPLNIGTGIAIIGSVDVPGSPGNDLLLESGDYLLLENGDFMLLEQ